MLRLSQMKDSHDQGKLLPNWG